MRAFSRNTGYAQFSRPAYSCAQIVLGSAKQRAEAAKVAHNSPKRKARLSRLGEIAIEHHTDWRAFSGVLHNFLRGPVERFASQGKTNRPVLPGRRPFLADHDTT